MTNGEGENIEAEEILLEAAATYALREFLESEYTAEATFDSSVDIKDLNRYVNNVKSYLSGNKRYLVEDTAQNIRRRLQNVEEARTELFPKDNDYGEQALKQRLQEVLDSTEDAEQIEQLGLNSYGFELALGSGLEDAQAQSGSLLWHPDYGELFTPPKKGDVLANYCQDPNEGYQFSQETKELGYLAYLASNPQLIPKLRKHELSHLFDQLHPADPEQLGIEKERANSSGFFPYDEIAKLKQSLREETVAQILSMSEGAPANIFEENDLKGNELNFEEQLEQLIEREKENLQEFRQFDQKGMEAENEAFEEVLGEPVHSQEELEEKKNEDYARNVETVEQFYHKLNETRKQNKQAVKDSYGKLPNPLLAEVIRNTPFDQVHQVVPEVANKSKGLWGAMSDPEQDYTEGEISSPTQAALKELLF